MKISKANLHHSLFRQAGVTLVELMVAMVIGLLLLSGLINVLMGSKKNHQWQDELSRLQENGRFAVQALSKEIRLAGYSGCSPIINNLLNPAGVGYSNALFDLTEAATGWEFSGTATGDSYSMNSTNPAGVALSSWNDATGADLSSGLQNQVVPGTDLMILKRASAKPGVTATGNTPANANTINLTAASGVAPGTILMISDCSGADVFQNRANSTAHNVTRGASNSNPGPGNVNPGSNNFSHRYEADAEIYAVGITVFYIGISGGGEPALYQIDYNLGSAGVPVALVEGVENMQILYGVDLDGDDVPENYVSADALGANADRVVAIRIALLLRSFDRVDQQSVLTSYSLSGVTIDTPNDGRNRAVITTTVKLRNRGQM